MTTWEWDQMHASFRTERSTSMKYHAKIGRYNATTYLGIQAVETGRMEPAGFSGT